MGIILILIASFQIAGGHWIVLQTVAWAGMMQNYSRIDGIERGMMKTFDGKHPCALCSKVKEGREYEQKKLPEKTDFKVAKKTTFLQETTPAKLAPIPWQKIEWFAFSDCFMTRQEPPPTPPPQLSA